MKYIKFLLGGLLFAVLFLCNPVDSKAQTTDDEVENAVDFSQGKKIYEDWFMESFRTNMKQNIWYNFDSFILFAKVIGWLMTIMFFAQRGYEMMTGAKQWEILPLLRPFGLFLIITFWGPFISFLSLPGDLMAEAMWEKQAAQQQLVNNLRIEREKYAYNLAQNIFQKTAEVDVATEQSKSTFQKMLDSAGKAVMDGLEAVMTPLFTLKAMMNNAANRIVGTLLEWLSLLLLRLATYLVISMQLIYSGILIMLGPISVALSIFPLFRDSFAAWISRFISVSLYTTIAEIIIFIGSRLQQFALESEINRYKEIVDADGILVSAEKLMYLMGSNPIGFGTVILTFLITAIMLFTVPSVSTWIVSTSGVSSAISTMGRAAPAVARSSKSAASSAARKIVTKGI